MRPTVSKLYFLALTAALISSLTLASAADAGKKKKMDAEDLFNPLLGVEYSHWLTGPAFDLATEKEIDRYLQLTSDEQAEAFIAKFWAGRNADTAVFERSPQQIYDQRIEDADKQYSEGTVPGSLTDRGKVFVIYGEPEDIEFRAPVRVHDPTVEVWIYPKDAPAGLDGEQPQREFRFLEVEGEVISYTDQAASKRRLKDRARSRRPFSR